MKLIIDIDDDIRIAISQMGLLRIPDEMQKKVDKAIQHGTPIPENATRKDVHKLIFNIEPPELDSPYCACANNDGCTTCKHKDDLNCDVNWWNAPYQKGGK